MLCADGHLGYSMPIGGVVAYREHISPSGVGFDIACGNKAVRTTLTHADIAADLPRIMDELFARISFGVGRGDGRAADHEVDRRDPRRRRSRRSGSSPTLAAKQLGTVGAGNHYVDLFRDDDDDRVWIGVHFGSRGFGHKTASGFLALAAGRAVRRARARGRHDEPAGRLPRRDSGLGEAYAEAMALAGRYAYAGRDVVGRRGARASSARGRPRGPQPPQLRLARGASAARPPGSCARARRRPSPASAASSGRAWASRR